MDFQTAVRTCLNKYVDFNGRARRSEFWYFVLFYFILYMVAVLLGGILGETIGGILTFLVPLALFLPYLAAGVRRLHDTDRTGWWVLIGLIPIVGLIVMIVFCVQPGTAGQNQYGPDPKA
ncbi:MAG: DUF805 domain-containing protein [Alphaproteobacteria bacterium]